MAVPRLFGVGNFARAPLRRRLVVFGGAFDPPHKGHLHVARAAARAFAADVWLVPNGRPPHRPRPRAAWTSRLRLCRLAAGGSRRLHVCAQETPARPRYAVNTLRALRARLPRARLWLLVGADSNLRQWRQWRQLSRLATVTVAARAGFAAPARARGKTVWRCNAPAAASRDLRAALCRPRAAAPAALPAPVWEEIRRAGLYNQKP